MAVEIEKLSTKQLGELISQAKRRKTLLAKRKPAAGVKRQVLSLVKKAGYTLEELFGVKAGGAKRAAKPKAGAKKSGGKVPPKYRNQDKPSETWTGRGKHPRWMAELLKKGRKVEDFLIKK
jgi:DNA-binding protein H-NS